jgi:hypothetical protein
VWGTVEQEPEVAEWLLELPRERFGRVQFYIDLLEERGVHLGEPYTRQLDGELRELRFNIEGEQYRVAYYVASGRRIVLLTVFHKAERQAPAEIERARRAMARCIAEGHTAEEDDGN